MSGMLVDTFGRVHRDLRVSVTDRCNLRCTYCMPPDFADWIPGDHLLSIDELMTVISVAVGQGIDSIRLTGGEPLVRPDIVEIVSRINAMPKAPRITLTTNALRLQELAQPLADAGLERVNISLDTGSHVEAAIVTSSSSRIASATSGRRPVTTTAAAPHAAAALAAAAPMPCVPPLMNTILPASTSPLRTVMPEVWQPPTISRARSARAPPRR